MSPTAPLPIFDDDAALSDIVPSTAHRPQHPSPGDDNVVSNIIDIHTGLPCQPQPHEDNPRMDSFETLVTSVLPALRSHARSFVWRTNPRCDADQIESDTLLAIAKNFHRWKIELGTFLSWALGICQNKCLEELRRQNTRGKHEAGSLDAPNDHDHPDASPHCKFHDQASLEAHTEQIQKQDEATRSADILAWLPDFSATLTAKQKQVFQFWLQQLDSSQIAKQLGNETTDPANYVSYHRKNIRTAFLNFLAKRAPELLPRSPSHE